MTDVGRRLWQGCHTLRHEGVSYGDYVDQLSLLLFLKMANELGATLPQGTGWEDLRAVADEALLDHYNAVLKTLGNEPSLIGEIFGEARSQFQSAQGLREIMNLLDDTHWSSLGRDVQGAAFEYLLERTASEGKQGAGQYFTPRALVQAIISCVRPGSLASDRVIGDPAMGTGGFLVEAHSWAAANHADRLQKMAFLGNEIVARVCRLALMNLHVHGAKNPVVTHGDALTTANSGSRVDVVVTNPPFGARSGPRPERADFWIATGNKQVNFVQHVVLSLSQTGRAAIVVPDGCFNGDRTAEQLWARIFEIANVHTILRLPKGTFAPYTAGTQTNVVFFTMGTPTMNTWIYDARTDHRSPTGRHPLRRVELDDFVSCYGSDPNGGAVRYATDSPTGRWSCRPKEDLSRASFRLEVEPAAIGNPGANRITSGLVAAERDLLAALRGIEKLKGLHSGR